MIENRCTQASRRDDGIDFITSCCWCCCWAPESHAHMEYFYDNRQQIVLCLERPIFIHIYVHICKQPPSRAIETCNILHTFPTHHFAAGGCRILYTTRLCAFFRPKCETHVCVSICIHECVCSSVAEHIFVFVRWAVAERLSGNIQRPSHHIVYSLRNTFMQMQLNKSKISLLVCSTRCMYMCAISVCSLAGWLLACVLPQSINTVQCCFTCGFYMLHASIVY